MSVDRERLVKALQQTLEQEDRRLSSRRGPLINYWHERPASDCWVKPNWRLIAEIAVDDVLIELQDDLPPTEAP